MFLLFDIEVECNKWSIVFWDVELGDVIVFYFGVFYGGGLISYGCICWVIMVCFYGDDVVYDV